MSDESTFGRISEKGGKVSIMSLDDKTKVIAQFNPKELQVDREVPWNPTGDQENPTNGKEKSKKSGGIDLEFTGAKGRSLTLELLFDGYEKSAGDGWVADVSGEIGKLEHLASIRNPEEKDEEKRRPHWCVVNWGTTLQGFRCVISSLSTKYTMFDPDGNPLRATCTVKLMEADSVSGKKKAAGGGAGGGAAAGTK
jgi:hypothetical protein